MSDQPCGEGGRCRCWLVHLPLLSLLPPGLQLPPQPHSLLPGRCFPQGCPSGPSPAGVGFGKQNPSSPGKEGVQLQAGAGATWVQ